MSENAKVLLNALSAYDSDNDSGNDSDKSESSRSKTASPEIADSSMDMPDQKEEEEEEEEDRREFLEYRPTKQKLEALLGCDKVSDFGPNPDMPPCSVELEEKFKHWYELKGQGANFNETLMRNKTFRNPNIYRWLVDHLQLDEAGTNFNQFDPAQLRNDFTAKGLADEQEKRAREHAARKAADTQRNVQFYSGGYEKLGSSSQHLPQPKQQNFEEAVARAKLIAQHLSRPKQP
ncbi:hypothetical protein EV183_000971 [Coemansia sp. RSA 2336]|nr:hypothetical protein EV183_000971 [Coemansia sp. RSA 2336]